MTTENTNTPQKADCPSATCLASWFLNGAEYRKRNGYIEARNNLNPDWVVVDKDESSDSMPNTTESRREFEEWLVDYYHESSIIKYDNGDYINVEAVVAWEAWQAARKQITEQRDRLAEALEHSMKHMRHSLNCPARITEGLHPCNCQMEWAYNNATEALQSLTTNEHE